MITVYTDNNPLVHLDTAKLGATEQRWVAQLTMTLLLNITQGRRTTMQAPCHGDPKNPNPCEKGGRHCKWTSGIGRLPAGRPYTEIGYSPVTRR